MSSNFQLFNPTQANQENDAAYVADATRLSGAIDGNEWPAASANKTLYQTACGIYALMQMMAVKGFVTNDTNAATLTAVLANILTTADLPGGLQSVAWSPSITLNTAHYGGFQVALAGETALDVTGQSIGEVIVILFAQDATGGRPVVYSVNFAGAAQPDPTPNVISAQAFKVNASGVLQAFGPNVSINGISGTAVGTMSPAAGNFTTLRLNGTAPSGQVLTGDGTNFIPTVAPGYTSGSSGGVYWEKNPNGRIEQWAQAVSLGSSDHVVSFLGGGAAFSNSAGITVEAVVVFPSGDTGYVTVAAGSISTSGFTLHQNNITGMSANWRATGY